MLTMSPGTVVFSIILIISSLRSTSAARILGIFPVTQKSHFNFNHAILRSLHDAGHRVTMVSPFPPSKNKNENFTYIDSRFDSFVFVSQSTIDQRMTESTSDTFHMFRKNEIDCCYNVMKLPQIQEALNSSQKLYDVMFVETWYAYECYIPMAEKLRVPLVGTSAGLFSKWADASVGNTQNPSTVLEFSDTNLFTNLKARAETLLQWTTMDYYYHTIINEGVEQFYRDHFPDGAHKENKVSLIFQNNHPSLLPRPCVPNSIDIGGIQVEPANPLPLELQKFIDEASHGVVLFSLGSIINVSSMSPELRREFLSAFESIPQRVIWKFEEPIENLAQNIMISKWLPQRDILEHKNVIAFMSHCGVGGVYEAVASGTPVVTIPLFADQFINAEKLQRRGVGVGLELRTATKETIIAALNTIINDTSYYERMQTLSLTLKDGPMTPQQSVVYWTEYVIKNNGARHLRALGTDMPLYKYFMLDVIALSAITASVILFFIFLGARKIYALVIRKL